MSKDNWYRNSDWNKSIEEHFYLKLERARTQRDQYIVIQAHSLSKTYPKVTLELIDYYFNTRTDEFHDSNALSAKVDAYKKLRKY